MKFSNHTIIIDKYPTPQESLLYSTRTQAMVTIDQTLRQEIGEQGPISEQYVKDVSYLSESGIVVENEEDELNQLKNFLGQLKYGVNKERLVVTVLTTYACNFKCVYCFQESSRTNEKMTFETSDNVIQWLKMKMIRLGYEELFINFYGGEPLVNKPTLEHIVGEMNKWCALKGRRFKFMLQTNGYLMTSECIDKYLTMGLDQVRISVDGIDEHDHNRPLRGGGKTFERVIENIVANVDKVMIGISTSYDKGEVGHIERLLEYFKDLSILHKLGQFIFSPIHPTLGPADQPERIQQSQCMCNYEDKTLVKTNRKIRTMMAKYNLPMRDGMSVTTCSLERENGGMTIDQKGDIYKCNSTLGHPELAIGNVKQYEYNQKHNEFINLDVWRQCPVDCTYLPMCSGGCRLMSFLSNKNFKTPSCKKPYLNVMAPEIIKKEYEKLISQQNSLEEAGAVS